MSSSGTVLSSRSIAVFAAPRMAVVTEPLDVKYRLITCSLISWSNTLLRCRGDCSFGLNAASSIDFRDSLSGFELAGGASCSTLPPDAAACVASALGLVPKAVDDFRINSFVLRTKSQMGFNRLF